MEYFDFKTLSGGIVFITCEQYSNSRNWGHRGWITLENGETFKHFITYYNRTWESFKFESLIQKMLRLHYNGAELDFLNKQVKAISEHKKEECEKWMSVWIKTYNNLNEDKKQALKNSDIILNSKEEADALITIASIL